MDDADARAALDRLIQERREDFAGLSRLLGRNPAYIQQYVKRGTPRRLAEADRRALAAYFGVPEATLGGPPARAPTVVSARGGGRRAEADLVAVPRLMIGASAGTGAADGVEQASADMLFPPALLRDLGAGRVSALSLIRVEGDSMLPTLAEGDDILVDRDDGADRLREGVYVLRLEEGLLVKRIAVGPGGAVSVVSDNPLGPRWEAVDRADLRIVGRVIWAGGRVR